MWMCEKFEGRMESMMVELWILFGSCFEGMKIPWPVRGLEVVIAIFLMLPGEMLVYSSVYTLIGPFDVFFSCCSFGVKPLQLVVALPEPQDRHYQLSCPRI